MRLWARSRDSSSLTGLVSREGSWSQPHLWRAPGRYTWSPQATRSHEGPDRRTDESSVQCGRSFTLDSSRQDRGRHPNRSSDANRHGWVRSSLQAPPRSVLPEPYLCWPDGHAGQTVRRQAQGNRRQRPCILDSDCPDQRPRRELQLLYTKFTSIGRYSPIFLRVPNTHLIKWNSLT